MNIFFNHWSIAESQARALFLEGFGNAPSDGPFVRKTKNQRSLIF
jgi:hypothetical protein